MLLLLWLWGLCTALAGGPSEELCVLAERPPRDPSEVALAPEGEVFVVPRSYRTARRALTRLKWPEDDVRPGEFVDHIPNQVKPARPQALSLVLEVAPHPLDDALHLARVLVVGPARPERQREPAHLTFLVDVSDSMRSVFTRSYPVLDAEAVDFSVHRQLFAPADRLSLARRAVALLVDELDVRGTLAIATYGAGSEIVLEPTPIRQGRVVRDALLDLGPPEETGVDRGLKLAYRLASKAFDPCDDNRLIVIGDGGGVLRGDLTKAYGVLSDRAASGVGVSAIGVGLRNGRSLDMERLATVGYGRAYYADSLYDAVLALRHELRPGGLVLRNMAVDVSFPQETVQEATAIISETDWIPTEISEGWKTTGLYALRLDDARGEVMSVSWAAESPVPGEWTHYGTKSIRARQVHERFEDASPDFRVAVAAALFAEALQAGDPGCFQQLFEIVENADRGFAADAELQALLSLAHRARAPRP